MIHYKTLWLPATTINKHLQIKIRVDSNLKDRSKITAEVVPLSQEQDTTWATEEELITNLIR